MKGKKYVWKFVLVLMVSGAMLAGCGDSGDKKADGGEKISLEIFQGKVEFNDAFEKLISEYEEENPDISIDVKAVGGGTDYIGNLKTKFSSGDEPDIFSIAGPTEAGQFEDSLADLSDMELADLALDGSLAGMKSGDKLLGVPFNQEGYGFVYNKSVFEEAGIDPDDLQSYEDFEEAVKTLDNQKEELGIEEVFAFPAKEKWVIGDHLLNTYLSPEFDQDVEEAYDSDSVEFEKGDELKRMLDLQNEYSIQPTLNLDYSQQVEEYFSLGQVAMIQQGNWIYPSIDDMDPDFAENNIGLIPMPVEGFEGKLPVGIPNHWGVNSNKDEETIQASKDFLDWMYTSEEGKEAVLNDFKFIPAYDGYDTEDIADPLSQTVYEYASEGNTIGWVFLGYPDNGWGDIFGGNAQKYLDDQMTWDEVIEDSRTEWENDRE